MSAEAFNRAYYEGPKDERGGFESYTYDTPGQQRELGKKWDQIERFAGDYHSILFIGCAKGFEVKFFKQLGKKASGVDISLYAISTAEPEVEKDIRLYDGSNLDEEHDDSVDVVAAFDVMLLVAQRRALINEMIRVARQFIFVRVTVLWPGGEEIGIDGVSFRYETLDWWIGAFGHGKFKFINVDMDWRREAVLCFQRA